MLHRVSLEESLSGDRVVLDVRTPSEYAQGHIPGAVNLPLFSDGERTEVGTIYKQESPEKALIRGLELIGPKMAALVQEAMSDAPGRRVLVHCWRGGKRSESVGWLLDTSGMDVWVLEGGYKQFRRWVLEAFDRLTPQLVVLGGKTGAGKTAVLQELARLGEQVLDLEELARHKGSAFGNLDRHEQPTVEQFENELALVLSRFDQSRRIWTEHESRSVGKVYLPIGFWRKLVVAPLAYLDVPAEARLQRSIREYGQYPLPVLRESFDRIRKRIGFQHHQEALDALEAGDIARAAAIALEYYDKTYQHFLETYLPDQVITQAWDGRDPGEIAQKLQQLV